MSLSARARSLATLGGRSAIRRSWSPAGVAGALGLGAWAGLFWFVMLSGRGPLYLSSRTDWVIPIGAVLLTLGAFGKLTAARTTHAEPLTRRGALRFAIVVLPVVVVLALPPTALGSFAVARRSTFAAADIGGDISSGRLGILDVAAGLQSRDQMEKLVRRAGERIALLGFVTLDDGAAADEFTLNRFIVSCCVADALNVQVRVVGAPPAKLVEDDWVRVKGRMYPLGREIVVDAERLDEVDRPKRPYVTP